MVALTSIAPIKASSPTIIEPVSAEISTQSHLLAVAQTQSQSLVVSVPLVNTSLTDHHNLVGSGQIATLPNALMPERSSSVGSVTERMSVISSGKYLIRSVNIVKLLLIKINKYSTSIVFSFFCGTLKVH